MAFLFDNWFGSLLRVTGVCVLFVLGHIIKFFRLSTITYSFRTIYSMDYDKKDGYKQMMERTGQQIAGTMFTMFLGVVLVLVITIF